MNLPETFSIEPAPAAAPPSAPELHGDGQRPPLNHLLESVVHASRVLLDAPSFLDGLRGWLSCMAQAVEADTAAFEASADPACSGPGQAYDSFWSKADALVCIDAVPARDEATPWLERLRAGEVVWTHRAPAQERAKEQGASPRARTSHLYMPVAVRTRFFGWLRFDWCEHRAWQPAYGTVVRAAADSVAAALQRNSAALELAAERERRIAIEKARADEAALGAARLERHSQLLAAVATATKDLLVAPHLDACFDAVLAGIGAVSRADRACLVWAGWTPADPVMEGSQQVAHEWTSPGAVRRIDSPHRHIGMRRDDEAWHAMSAHVRRDSRLLMHIGESAGPLRSMLRALGAEWALYFPIEVAGDLRGWLALDYAAGIEPLDETDIAALQTVASAVAHAMQRQELEQRSLATERSRADENARLASLLAQVVQSSRALIDAEPQAFESALLRWLGMIGRETRATRAAFCDLVDFGPTGQRTARMLCEWVREGVEDSVAVSFAQPVVIDPRGAEDVFTRMMSGQVVAFHTDELSGPVREFLAKQGNATVITVPVFIDGRQWGNLSFDYAERHDLQGPEVAVLQTAADTLAAVLKRNETATALLSEREARLAVERERSLELGEANEAMRLAIAGLARRNDLSSFFGELLLAAIDAMGAQTGAVVLFDGTVAEHLVLRTRDGWMPIDTMRTRGLYTVVMTSPAARDFLAWLPTAPRHWVASPEVDWMPPTFKVFHREQRTRGISLVPLLIEQRLAGWVGLGFDDLVPPSADRGALLRVLCDQITVAIELSRFAEQARLAAVAHEREVAAQQRAAELARTNEVLKRSVARLAESRDLTAFLEHVLTETMHVLDGAIVHVQIFLYDRTAHTLTASLGVGREGVLSGPRHPLPSEPFTQVFPADITPAWQRMLDAGKPVLFDVDVDTADFWPGTVAWHRQQGHRGSICTAMRVGDEPIGVLGVAIAEQASVNAVEVDFLQVFAQQAALAIQTERYAVEAERAAVARERAYAEQERMGVLTRANASLRRASRSLVEGAPLEDFLAAVMRETTAMCSARSAGVFLFDEATQELRMTAFMCDGQSVRIDADPRMALWRQPVPSAIVERWIPAIRASECVCFDNRVQPEHHPWPISRDWHATFGHTHVIDVPLYAGGQLVGLLGHCFCGDEAVGRFDHAHTLALAHLAALAIQQQRLSDIARQALMANERERAERARLAELARSNQALRVSIDALAEADADEAFLRRSLIEITMHAGAHTGYLFKRHEPGAVLRLIGSARQGVFSARGEAGDPPSFTSGLHMDPALLEMLIAHGRLAWRPIEPSPQATACDGEASQWHMSQGHRASALHAMLVGDRLVGLICLVFGHEKPLSEAQNELIHALCQPLTLALELSRLAKQAQRSGEQAAVLTERNRLAREIHDGIAQSFLGIQMQLEVPDESGATPAAVNLDQARALARHGLNEARRAVAALRPHELMNRDLPNGLSRLLTQMTAGRDLRARLEQPQRWLRLPPEVEDHLFRIVQEAVNNVIRHAQAKTLRVELSQAAGEVSVLVADDGIGFETESVEASAGFGMEGMRQRAMMIGASLACFSRKDEGTQILVSLAVPDTAAPDPPDTRHAS